MVSESQKRANMNYRHKSTKQVVTVFYPGDMDLYEYLQKKENKQGYIKALIRADMENASGGTEVPPNEEGKTNR